MKSVAWSVPGSLTPAGVSYCRSLPARLPSSLPQPIPNRRRCAKLSSRPRVSGLILSTFRLPSAAYRRSSCVTMPWA